MSRIQRQYSLPNCTLILDGMDDPARANPMDLRPVMTMLLNAECHLGNGKSPIAGGREFFESLVTAVSLYAQEFLSAVHLPKHVYSDKPAMVQMKRLGDNQHELSYKPTDDTNPNAKPETLQLTTVQLFDLVEAIDQFVADTQTLPFWSLNLAPVPKKFAPTASLSKQAVPAAVGLSGLAIAAAAMFAIPTPMVKQPEDLRPGTPNVAVPAPTASQPSAVPDVQKIQTDLTAVAPIQDPAEITKLQMGLTDRLSAQFNQPNAKLTGPIDYRVSVGKDGNIVGFQPQNDLARVAVNETPLPGLLLVPTADKKPEAIADYRVTFTPDGKVDVKPWSQTTAAAPTSSSTSSPISSPTPAASPSVTPESSPIASPSPSSSPASTPTPSSTAVNPSTAPTSLQTGEITESATIDAIQPKLYEQLDKAWQTKPAFNEDLRYRVRVNKDGAVIGYEADNRAARDYENETPLPKLGKPLDGTTVPDGTASFKVIFKPNGRLEINPWYGYKP
jgi:Domain of unknown function (DUF4335)